MNIVLYNNVLNIVLVMLININNLYQIERPPLLFYNSISIYFEVL